MFFFGILFLQIFKLLNLTPFAFRGTADTAVAFFESILACHLDALVFFLWSSVDHEPLDERRTYAVGRDGEDFDFLMELVEVKAKPLPYFHLMGRLKFPSFACQLHLAALAGVGGEGARLIETHGPEVFVESHGVFLNVTVMVPLRGSSPMLVPGSGANLVPFARAMALSLSWRSL